MRPTLKEFLLFGFLVDFSTSSASPWKPDGGNQVKLAYGTVVTQTEFDGNAYASAAMGMVVGPGGDCLGALVSDKYFLYTELSKCPASNPPYVVKVGSRYTWGDTAFNGDTDTILSITHLASPPLTLAKISPNSTSNAKPVSLPPTSLLHTPPPVGTKCNAWGFGGISIILNRLAVTIVSIPDCKSRWGAINSSVGIPEDGSVFCAWVTWNGTAEAGGSICNQQDAPSVIICEEWAPPTPPTNPPSCGWHKSGGGGRRTISEVLAMKNERVVPSYLLAGFFRKGFYPEGNCNKVGVPVIYTYTGGVISNI